MPSFRRRKHETPPVQAGARRERRACRVPGLRQRAVAHAARRRAAAALGRAGRHRPGLPPRRGGRGRRAARARPARARHHERRHRVERRRRALARRAPDQRGRAAPGRRLRLRPDHRDRPGRRAARHPAGDQHRRRAADHRAGLQVRVPQLPDRADDPRRRVRQPARDLLAHRQRAEDGGVHARERHLRRRPCRRASPA